ncbi:hypothetical protein JCM33774_07620 [Actinophytocola sp. KF-1]
MVVTAAVCALVALGALAAAAYVRHERTAANRPGETTTPSTTTSGPGADGCLADPCRVLGPIPIGGTTVQLVVDAGGKSGRLQIGGGGASDVIEVTITKLGAVLGPDALQCVGGTLSACVVRGSAADGVLGQVIVGRSGKWASLEKPFASDAGFVAVQDVTGQQSGPEVLVAQHRCDRTTTADCSDTDIHVQIYSMGSEVLGCTRDYARLESMPGWPDPDLTEAAINPCD